MNRRVLDDGRLCLSIVIAYARLSDAWQGVLQALKSLSYIVLDGNQNARPFCISESP